ncbi:hypothetical protein NPIL_579171 [Nephila pilipes]|uniref:Uncharacterized protein n=1 Tax=Nephila pilipes TaxID=299642 RepID=A0A8X6QWQ3_NEPPI|nr:hypothetical protein NPIL_579171 [Nephila pilipes]
MEERSAMVVSSLFINESNSRMDAVTVHRENGIALSDRHAELLLISTTAKRNRCSRVAKFRRFLDDTTRVEENSLWGADFQYCIHNYETGWNAI